MAEHLEIALFGEGAQGVRLIGRLRDPDLVTEVRGRIAEIRRRELVALERPAALAAAGPGDPSPS
jgi:hypothetical protein